MSQWLEGLNPEQKESVLHVENPLLILAGAGSGKTTVLISRCGYLIEKKQAEPKQIQVLTFTNKAARELKHRVSLRLGAQAKKLNASTFHSFGLKFLRRHYKYIGYQENFGLIDQSDAFGILRDLSRDLTIQGKDKFDFEEVYKLVLELRIYGKIKSSATDEYLSLAEWIYPKYIKALKHLSVFDFEDLILKPIEILKNNPQIKSEVQEQTLFWMIDEFQDTNDLQMKLIHELVSPDRPNITVVGDDDQAIYGFRGAQVKHILGFPKEFKNCRVIRLERNYRSTKAILELANRVIGQNKERHGKALIAQADFLNNQTPEFFVLEDEIQESEFIAQEINHLFKKGIAHKNMAVLYRANSQAQLIESELKQAQIPYSITGGISLFDRKEIKDVACYLRLSLGYHELSCRRVINIPPRGIGEVSLDLILNWCELNSKLFLEGLNAWSEAGVDERVGHSIHQFLELLNQLPILLEYIDEKKLKWGEEFYQFLKKIGYIDHLLSLKVKDSADEISFEKRLTPLRIFLESGDRFIEKLKLEEPDQKLSYYIKKYLDIFQIREEGTESTQVGVQLMTFHASKGLEFDHVFLIGIEEDLLPHKILGLDIDEERRLFYVGITRAKQTLVLTRAEKRKKFGTMKPVAPSRFINDLGDSLKSYSQGVRPINKGEIQNTVQAFLKELGQKVQNK